MPSIRAYVIGVICVAGCTSEPSVDSASLVGTWNGTQSNGKAFRYTFGTDGNFVYGPVEDGTFAALASGTFSTDGDNVILDASVLDEDGGSSDVRLASEAYANGSSLCIGAYHRSDPTVSSTSGTWMTVSTTQALDANGAPTGAVTSVEDDITLNDDGTMNDLNLDADGSVNSNVAGTWIQAGTMITLTEQDNDISQVESYTIVDDQVFCDPAFTH
jgi:hypothetical protein